MDELHRYLEHHPIYRAAGRRNCPRITLQIHGTLNGPDIPRGSRGGQ